MARHARVILDEFERTGDDLVSLSHGVTGRLAVGGPPSASMMVLPKSVARFKQRYPHTRVLIQEGAAEDLIAKLRSGALDLVVGMIASKCNKVDLKSIVLYNDRMVVAVGAAHPLVNNPNPGWGDLVGLPWILPPLSLVLRVFIEDVLHSHGLSTLQNYVESVSVEAYIGLLGETNAVAFVPERVAQHFARIGRVAVLPLALPDVPAPVSVTWMRGKPLRPPVQELIDCMREIEDERGPD